jgi:putative transcriptional regulator
MDSLAGRLLVASPYLVDPNFAQTVVLLIHHSDEGAVGVVLNRRSEKSIQELWEEVSEGTCDNQQCLHLGGPVSGPLIAVHTNSALAELEIVPGLYFSAHRDHIAQLITEPDQRFRLFVGHSGWGGGQLENELTVGSWLTAPATVDYVFWDETDLWKTVSKQIGESLLLSTLHIEPTQIPPDPSVN